MTKVLYKSDHESNSRVSKATSELTPATTENTHIPLTFLTGRWQEHLKTILSVWTWNLVENDRNWL